MLDAQVAQREAAQAENAAKLEEIANLKAAIEALGTHALDQAELIKVWGVKLPSGAYWYWVILKKVSFGVFRTILVSKEEKNFYYKKQRQRAISEQVFIKFGHGQNHQN